jgi:NAD(P)H-nitrite reductase large subunit
MSDKIIFCRCEDITEEEILEAIQSGVTTLEEMKRHLRAGAGACQGRTCGPMISSILARKLNIKPREVKEMNKRPPLKPVPAGVFFQEDSG